MRHRRSTRYTPLRLLTPLVVTALLTAPLTGSRLGHSASRAIPEPAAYSPTTDHPVLPIHRAPARPSRSEKRTPAAGIGWTGYAFDTCSAPSQRVMSRWLKRSPFVGVGVYLGGVQRACDDQKHLNRAWVRRQTDAGWKLLPLWVGPQASCTGYAHRIPGSPGPHRRFPDARANGVRQARHAVRAARALGIRPNALLFYDLESFDAGRRGCVHSSLAFLEAWTTRLHRLGYRAGVYSHVNAGIKLLAATPRSYRRPDAVWYAWIDRANARPKKYISEPGFMRKPRIHQFAIDKRVRFGGVHLDIDWNYVSLGASSDKTPLLKLGAHGAPVRRLQKQLNARLPKRIKVPVDGSFGRATARAVKRFQAHLGAAATSVVTPHLWHALTHP